MKSTNRSVWVLKFIPFIFLLTLITITIGRLHEESSASGEEEPGYFEQWFNEKKNAQGEIPSWQQARWAAWDKSRVQSRGTTIAILDSVFELGPVATGGRTRGLWVDPRNDNVILAAGISGGVWRSEDGGQNWIPLNDQQSSLMASCFTSNPFNPDIVYYGTGEGRANSADVDGNGVYKSTDGGKTFSVLASTVGLSGFETIWDIKHSQTDSNTLFVGTDSKGLWRSTDGGATWAKVLTTSNPVTNILTLPDDRVIACLHAQYMQISDSGGKAGTFVIQNKITGWPVGGTYRRTQLANCASFPNVVYALVEGYGFNDPPAAFFKSSDGGRNWIKQTNPQSGAGYQAYCVMLGVNPADSNQVIAGGVNIAQSNNGGVSWSNKAVGHSDHHSFASFSKGSAAYFIVGTDGGVFKYKYSSASVYANLNNGYKVTQFYAGDYGPGGYVSISGAQDNGSHVATAPLTSQKFYGADGGYAHIGLQDGKVAYISSQNEGIRRIRNFTPYQAPGFTDDISDPSFTSDGVNFINAYNINPADQNQLYYRTNKYLYRTIDGGLLWEPITNIHSGLKAIGISNEANPIVYTGGSAAQLYRIENAAETTQGKEISFNSSFPVNITGDFINSIVVHPWDKNTVFISFSNYSNEARIWKISGLDSANPVFTNISGDLPPGLPVNYIAVDPYKPEKYLFAGTDFGLYYSTDSGNTWVKETRIPNVAVHEVKMRKDRKLFIYTHGRGMWYASLIPPGPDAVKNIQVANAKVFPNPLSNELNIELHSPASGGECTIYSTDGKIVLNRKLLEKSEVIHTENLQNGFYFVRIKNDGGESSFKIIVRH